MFFRFLLRGFKLGQEVISFLIFSRLFGTAFRNLGIISLFCQVVVNFFGIDVFCFNDILVVITIVCHVFLGSVLVRYLAV